MELKRPLSFDEQIARLIEHGMYIRDKAAAKEVLARINYYRLTGYALQYRKTPSDSDYKEGTSFDTIYQIMRFDEAMRDVLRIFIEKAEIYYRTQIAYGFSSVKCVNPPHDQHYMESNFYNKQGYREVMGSFAKEKQYYKDSLIVKHHKRRYGNKMPLWVIVELMTFSNISKLYGSMYESEQNTIAELVGTTRKELRNHLHCLAVLRNKCAHAARLYNTDFNPPVKLSQNFLRKNPNVKNNSLFAYILVLLKRLPDVKSKDVFLTRIEGIIEEYKDSIDLSCVGFPENYAGILRNNR